MENLTRPARIGLLSLGIFTAISLLCIVAFVENPQNLSIMPWFSKVFVPAFSVFAQLHVVLCFALIFTLFAFKNRTFWIGFAWVYFISLAAELGGTTQGIPFGLYRYTDLLGPKIAGHVPYLIPVSWFVMGALSFGLAYRIFPKQKFHRIMFGSLLIVFWDLSLDPAMSYKFSYWQWISEGSEWFYGMPWINLAGWFITSLAICLGLDALRFSRTFESLSSRTLLIGYGLVASLGLGFVVIAGLWKSVFLSVAAYVFLWIYAKGFDGAKAESNSEVFKVSGPSPSSST